MAPARDDMAVDDDRDRGAMPVPQVIAEGESGDGPRDGAVDGEPRGVAGPALVSRWIEVQRATIEEAQSIQDMAWQQARAWHPGLQRAIEVRRRRNIRLVKRRSSRAPEFLRTSRW